MRGAAHGLILEVCRDAVIDQADRTRIVDCRLRNIASDDVDVMPRPRQEVVAIEPDQLACREASPLQVDIALGEAANIERKAHESGFDSIAAPQIQNLDSPPTLLLKS